MRERIETEDRLYLHFDQCEPKFLVVADDAELGNAYVWTELGLGIIMVDTAQATYEQLHPLYHAMLGNECRGMTTKKPYRTKEGSAYGRMIRYGGHDDTVLNGCVDLPLFDVDAIEVEDGRVVALVELKHRGERLTQAQRRVLRNCRRMGIEYLEDTKEEER